MRCRHRVDENFKCHVAHSLVLAHVGDELRITLVDDRKRPLAQIDYAHGDLRAVRDALTNALRVKGGTK